MLTIRPQLEVQLGSGLYSARKLRVCDLAEVPTGDVRIYRRIVRVIKFRTLQSETQSLGIPACADLQSAFEETRASKNRSYRSFAKSGSAESQG